MGLGLLFIGYFTLTIAALPLPGIATFVGYLLTGHATTKLSAYQDWFRYSRIISFVGAALSIPNLTKWLLDLIGTEAGFLAFSNGEIYQSLIQITLLAFHVAMYLAICKLATVTGVEKIRVSSARNLVFFCFVFTARAVFNLLSYIEPLRRIAAIGGAVCTLAYIVVLILTHVMLFSAYMWICDENDVDMPLKKSRFEFVNKIREETARREQKAADDSVEYAKQRLEKRKEERERKKRR